MERHSLPQVVSRIFPLRRGLFEDYVANFWCTSSVAIKWKQVRAAEAQGGVGVGLE
jgi:alpha-1,3-glucosyltransferase